MEKITKSNSFKEKKSSALGKIKLRKGKIRNQGTKRKIKPY